MTFNAGRTNSDAELLHPFFERAVQHWPDCLALDLPPDRHHVDRRRYTYSELRALSAVLAGPLADLVDRECVVAILLPRTSAHLYAAQLAVLRSGAAFTCIDPAFPDEQVKTILEDSQAVALLTDDAGQGRARQVGFDATRVFDTQTLPPAPNRQPAAPWLQPESLAYLIYTSGTTGRPKGVMIEHRSIANLVASDLSEFGLTPADRVAQGSSPSYDSSLEEIWLAWAAGAAVVVMADEASRLGPDLVPWLRHERISVLCPPPTLLRTMSCADPATALPDLRLLYVGGEALPRDVADRWGRGCRLVNGYGPTECTVTCLRTDITEDAPITIGRPVPGLHAWVLDAALNEVPEGEQGELCIGGLGLARGYRHQPALTAQKFPDHPQLGRLYRTGDLVHLGPDGACFFHGRMDAQVKLRGYRIELEAIEARLVECEGVREAACCLQGEGAHQTLVAFLVPEDSAALPSFEGLTTDLQRMLPTYMVPQRWGLLPGLPTTVGGKLDRKRLPILESETRRETGPVVAPRSPVEAQVLGAFQRVLGWREPISIHDDFFADLAGDSLSAAMVVSLLREDAATDSVTMRDVYEARTAAVLGARLEGAASPEATAPEHLPITGGHPRLVTLLQGLWLLLGLLLGSPLAYLVSFQLLPFLAHRLGLVPLLLLSPMLYLTGLALYTTGASLLLILVKHLLIGRYVPLRAPVWGSFFLRNWMVQQTARLVPWRALEGTLFQQQILRGLGARIGQRVHLHRGVNLIQGGWDLLEIGDDVAIGQEVTLRLVDLQAGQIVVCGITLGEGSTLETRAGMDGGSSLGPGAHLTALSSLASGEHIPASTCWNGVPANLLGPAPSVPVLPEASRVGSPWAFSLLLILSRFGLQLLLALPLELLMLGFAFAYGIDADHALAWLYSAALEPRVLLATVLLATLPVPFTLALEALAVRSLGRVQAGVISCWSTAYLRVWLKGELLQAASDWLSGTLFWPLWLRTAGMKVGSDCEISTILDVVPELVEIGPASFFADGIYLGGPRIQSGIVTLAPVQLGKNTFLGNHALIPAGQRLPEDILLGVCTVADDRNVRPGSSWFGHPPFELPRREVVAVDRSLTHEPSFLRYWNRVFWETARVALPIVPALVLLLWFKGIAAAEANLSGPAFLLMALPLVNLATATFFTGLILGLKWGLLGRVQPGQHPLWSCWCSRWDFLYVAWGMYARAGLSALEGTLFLTWYLRLAGMHIGPDVVLGPGFAQVVDPDMLTFEAGATVSALFQAHTFEDRVLKIDRIRIRRGATVGGGAVLLYGADIGEGTWVAANSVVMKRERLLPGRSYSGCPTRT
jgi:non-ribosomal peptide synthetase-like protein